MANRGKTRKTATKAQKPKQRKQYKRPNATYEAMIAAAIQSYVLTNQALFFEARGLLRCMGL
jgi:hypothetical protein